MVKGSFIYENLRICQHPDILDILKKLLTRIQPAQILEIGTMHGGFTLMIRNTLNSVGMTNTQIRTYDINEQKYLKQLNINNIDIITKNVFDYTNKKFLSNESRIEIENYIGQPGRTIVFCDGGSKPNEFRLLADLIKPDDIIMAHDYAPNSKFYNEYMHDKIWNWMEIWDDLVQESVEKNQLEKFMYDELLSVAWLCMRKR